MSYQKHKSLIDNLTGRNILCDDSISITYEDLPKIIMDLGGFFEGHNKNKIACIGLIMQNTVAHVLVLLYLLSERINFFIYSGSVANEQNIPPFCDKIVTISAWNSVDLSIAGLISVQENPCYRIPDSTEFKPNSGTVLFTSSGTTGPVKFVQFNHENLIQNARNCIERFGLNNNFKILIPVPVSHMYGLGVGLLPALLSGASICLIKKNVLKLLDKLDEFQPTITLITPTIAKMILLLNKTVSDKSIFITAGERIDLATYKKLASRYGHVINLYGCSELGAIATSSLCANVPIDNHEDDLMPLERVEVMISEDDSSEVLCKHNAGFQRYVDKYGNARKNEAEAMWYKTKDRGLRLGQNGFKILGRIDNCVNRSGFLISLEEIEASIQVMFSEIDRVVVFDIKDDERIVNRLIAVCELNSNYEVVDVETVKRTCQEKLNRYLLPDEFHFVKNMPRLRNGKPDRLLIINQFKESTKT